MGEIRVLEAFGEPIADGGQEAFVFGVLEKMDMTGLKADCLTAYDCRSMRYRSLAERKGGRIYALNLPFSPGKSRENIRKPFREFLRDHKYDIVHIHSGSISVLAIMAEEADKAGAGKVIVHSHASGDRDDLKHKVLRYLSSFPMSRHVDIYCACSKEAAEWKFEPKYSKDAVIIKNGIDPDRFRYDPEIRVLMRQKLGLDGKFVAGHVGRFSKEKNHRFLISVFENVLHDIPSAHLLLVGTGDELEDIKELVENKGLTQNVTFTGSVDNVEDYLQAMDVFVLPSLFEGLGIAAVEAQCSGLPVIASDAVPSDADTGNMTFCSLDSPASVWAQEIGKKRNEVRKDSRPAAEEAGFDINETAGLVRELYLRP